MAWMWPPVSTNERPGYNEHIRHCFRYEHSFKERFVKYPRQQRNTCANQIHRDNLNKYSNGFLFENTDLIRLSHVLGNNNPAVDTRYCLMTIFMNWTPVSAYQVQCHAVSRRVSRCHECNVSPVMNVIIRYSYTRYT